MTDEQIEKALERMATSRCSDVTNFDYADTLDYIKRLKDEIAGLTGAVEALKTDNANLTRTLEECNENLQENLEKAYEHNEDEYGCSIVIKQEAIDRFEVEIVGNIHDNPELLEEK